ncbi:MAG: type VI secretion system baseplate subunit TssK [Nannocystis sp.]|nr:type VI secretion system baseplate subunit TssK [Nannocystis sp.]
MNAASTLSPSWSDGLLLCPQHLQQLSGYHDARLDARLAALSSEPWGVLELRIDPAALAAGSLRLTRLRALLPDGTPVDIDADRDALPARPIAPHFPPDAPTLPVHLALPELRRGAANIARSGDTTHHRYRVIELELPDLHHSGATRPIELLLPAPRLLLGDEPQGGHTALKIAELCRAADGSFAIVDPYIPPLLALRGSAWLRHALAELIAVAIARWRALRVELHRQRGAAEAEARDLGRTALLQILGRTIPPLMHQGDAPIAAPRDLFERLLALAGELALFVRDADPSALPRYQHDDLRASFGPLFATIRAQIGAALRVDHIDLGLTQREDGLWIAELGDDRLASARTIVLVIAAEGANHLPPEGIAELIKVAAWRRIPALVRSNSRGAPLRHLTRPPAALPIDSDERAYLIDPRDPHWREALEERSLAVHLSTPCDPRRARVRAFAIPKVTWSEDHNMSFTPDP